MSPSAKLNPSRIDQARLAGIETEMPIAAPEGVWPTEVLLFTQIPVDEAIELQQAAATAMRSGTAPGHRLIVTEHPSTILENGVFLPGMLTAWAAVHTEHSAAGAGAFGGQLGELAEQLMKRFGIEAKTEEAEDGALALHSAEGRQIANCSIIFEGPIALVQLSIFTNVDPQQLAEAGVSAAASMTDLGMPVERQSEVRTVLLELYESIFQSKPEIPQRTGVRTAKPPWLRVKLPLSNATRPVHDIVKERGLHTVCESARCPNQGECWGHGTATFMINGDVCTRSCSFCAVFTGRPKPIDEDEPRRVAEAARLMGLKYSVVTAVNRDELADGGAGQFAATIRELRAAIPDIRVETLIPDFRGVESALDLVFAERPDVLNHNIETVPRLYSRVRPQARYERSLEVLSRAKQAGLIAKSGFMLGLGEEEPEVAELLRDLRKAGVDIVTIGQYLRPSEYHHPVVRYATPAEFARWKEFGTGLGFQTVQSGPLVRSSYHAHESFAGA